MMIKGETTELSVELNSLTLRESFLMHVHILVSVCSRYKLKV